VPLPQQPDLSPGTPSCAPPTGSAFFTDAPLTVFPVRWQDTGSGVFAFTTAALAAGLDPCAPNPPAARSRTRCWPALAALAVDVHLH